MTDECVHVREYRPADRPAVMALAPRLMIGVAPWRDPAAVCRAVTGWVEGSLDRHDPDHHPVYVAEHAGIVVGAVTVGTREHFTGELDAYVGELVVTDHAQCRRVGTALMRTAEQWAGDRGFRHLTLETGAANEAARAFYGSLGYREEDVRLTRSLAGPAEGP